MNQTPPARGPVDIHAHFIPRDYLKALEAEGIATVDGYPLPSWDRESAIDLMDRRGLLAQVISVSAPGVDVIPAANRSAVVRAANEEAAEVAGWRPDRFGAFALLPLPDIDATLREIEYAYDTLKLDGVGLYTNVQGRYLGDPQFRPVLEELNRRNATIFIHPVAPPGFENLDTGLPAPTIEYPFDTTRTVMTLVGSGIMDACRNLKIILPHGGGTLPFLALRTSLHLARFAKQLSGKTSEDVLAQYRSFYFDLTAVSHPFAIDALLTLAPPDRLLYGSDHPFMPESVADTGFTFLNDKCTASGERLSDLVVANGNRLFPRFSAG
jgi:predicted TIM-barrel fold metal-dependent hydrolase